MKNLYTKPLIFYFFFNFIMVCSILLFIFEYYDLYMSISLVICFLFLYPLLKTLFISIKKFKRYKLRIKYTFTSYFDNEFYSVPYLKYEYNKFIEKYGVQLQLIIAMEELSELIQEISKVIRFPKHYSKINLISEIIDSRIMIDQVLNILRYTHGKLYIQQIYKKQLEKIINKAVHRVYDKKYEKEMIDK